MRVVFPYIAQIHQVPHSLPIAVALAMRYPDLEVTVAANSSATLSFIERLLADHAPSAPLRIARLLVSPLDRLLTKAGLNTPGKHRTLRINKHFFEQFDALVTPESTTLYLKRLGLGRTRLIRTGHGAGDREVSVSPRIRDFDYVLVAGPKLETRMMQAQVIQPGRYSSGIYAKFDWTLDRSRLPRLFGNDRPVVLYNPHFRENLSSWPTWGRQVLAHFSRRDDLNLVFAPHVRLFDAFTGLRRSALAEFEHCPNIHIDTGSERCVDMTYTAMADLYLGDVSSQVTEFLFRPRPCVFLNAHGVAWRQDPSYRFWQMGPVVESLAELPEKLAQGLATHERYLATQRQYFAESYGDGGGNPTAPRGADAIYRFLTAAA